MKTYKKRLYKIINEKDNNLLEKYNRYVNEIVNKTYLFNRIDILNKHLELLQFCDLIEFIKVFMNHDNCIKIIISGN
jgi:secreted Zn-dependent insulinase-like peptidase